MEICVYLGSIWVCPRRKFLLSANCFQFHPTCWGNRILVRLRLVSVGSKHRRILFHFCHCCKTIVRMMSRILHLGCVPGKLLSHCTCLKSWESWDHKEMIPIWVEVTFFLYHCICTATLIPWRRHPWRFLLPGLGCERNCCPVEWRSWLLAWSDSCSVVEVVEGPCILKCRRLGLSHPDAWLKTGPHVHPISGSWSCRSERLLEWWKPCREVWRESSWTHVALWPFSGRGKKRKDCSAGTSLAEMRLFAHDIAHRKRKQEGSNYSTGSQLLAYTKFSYYFHLMESQKV